MMKKIIQWQIVNKLVIMKFSLQPCGLKRTQFIMFSLLYNFMVDGRRKYFLDHWLAQDGSLNIPRNSLKYLLFSFQREIWEEMGSRQRISDQVLCFVKNNSIFLECHLFNHLFTDLNTTSGTFESPYFTCLLYGMTALEEIWPPSTQGSFVCFSFSYSYFLL